MTVSVKSIRNAAHFLQQEKLVAFPTETVYGLGGNALSDSAVASIYAAKGRPSFNPLIVHIRSPEEAWQYGAYSEAANALAHAFWPGPLTLVLPRRDHCTLSLLVSAGLDTVALRVPAHPLAQALLHEAGLPVAAPSANRSGRVSPTDASHVHEELGNTVAAILDGGPCLVGIESTVVDLTSDHPVILRPGSITPAQIAKVLDHDIQTSTGTKILAPGMLKSHYAPSLPVRLNATQVNPSEALLAFGKPIHGAAETCNLSPSGDLHEAAANLFRMLRQLDKAASTKELTGIAVMPIPTGEGEHALGLAINDRLERAAAPRPQTS